MSVHNEYPSSMIITQEDKERQQWEKTKMNIHTPTPWKLRANLTASAPIIVAETTWTGREREREVCKCLFDMGSEDPEVFHNAEHIVKCVNAHDELIDFIEESPCECVYTDDNEAHPKCKRCQLI